MQVAQFREKNFVQFLPKFRLTKLRWVWYTGFSARDGHPRAANKKESLSALGCHVLPSPFQWLAPPYRFQYRLLRAGLRSCRLVNIFIPPNRTPGGFGSLSAKSYTVNLRPTVLRFCFAPLICTYYNRWTWICQHFFYFFWGQIRPQKSHPPKIPPVRGTLRPNRS